jgi:tetratricopeptide (TPR) repeat protein
MAGHPKAEAFKAEGNKYFKNGDYKNAVTKYREATSINPNDPAYWSNMAACYEKLTEYDEMEDAARNCIKADKAFVKGYFRLATSLKAKNDLEGCIKALESGLAVDSTNADLKKMKKDLTELQRGENVSKYISKCEEQMANGQIAEAYKSLELASRLDAGNPDIERMMAKVKPKYDRMEQQRRANLSSDEVYKERGDDAFKNAQFEGKWKLFCVCVDEMDGEGGGCVRVWETKLFRGSSSFYLLLLGLFTHSFLSSLFLVLLPPPSPPLYFSVMIK